MASLWHNELTWAHLAEDVAEIARAKFDDNLPPGSLS